MDDPKTTERSRITVVEEGTHFKGSMSSSCPVVVKGAIAGDVQTPALTIMPTGSVSGRIQAGTLISQGQLGGMVDAERAQVSGSVIDETTIRAKSLEVKLDAEGGMTVTFGETKLEVGEAPERPK